MKAAGGCAPRNGGGLRSEGVKPVGTMQHEYAKTWLYGAIAPASGDAFFLLLPHLDTTNMQVFVDTFATTYATTYNVVVLDNSAAHTTKDLRLPDNMAFVFLPPYSPELNPAERVWLDLRGRMAWQQFADLECLEDELCVHLDQYDAATFQSLTSYPYLIEAIHTVGPWPDTATLRSI